jgi:MFS family permease
MVQHSANQALEKRVLWKLDCRILPPLTLVYLASFLDRTNIGNAKIAGLENDLHLHGIQFNTALAVFFVTYIIAEVPSNVVLKRLKPNRWLGFLIVAWGIVTVLTGLVRNYASLVAVRLLLGLCEGGLVPGVILYLSYMYRRDELQSRIAIFYAAASFSGAFGGLLASAIIHMDGVGGLAGWRWIFILDGLVTVLLATIAIYTLPVDVASARFLTEEEREYALRRLKADCELASTNDELVSGKIDHSQEFIPNCEYLMSEEEVFEWRELWRGFLDIQTWLLGLAFTGMVTGLYSFSFFFPTIVAGLGYSGTQAQLHTVPPFAIAVVLTVAVAIVGDRIKMRAPFVLALLPLTMMGYIIAITGNTNIKRYIGSCFIAAGTYPSLPCLYAVIANNTGGHYKRATSTAMQAGFANASGFIATFIYTSDQAPRYIRGHTISVVLAAFAWILVALNILYCMWENKARREGRRDSNIAKYKVLRDAGLTKAPIGDRHPNFLFIL